MRRAATSTRPQIVPTRLLAAEATASAALALVQSPALWSALELLGQLLDGSSTPGLCTLTVPQADEAVALLDATDHTARSWAAIAHPGARFQAVPMLGKVT